MAPVHVWMVKIMFDDMRDLDPSILTISSALEVGGASWMQLLQDLIACCDSDQSGSGGPPCGSLRKAYQLPQGQSPVPWILWDAVRIWWWQDIKNTTAVALFPPKRSSHTGNSFALWPLEHSLIYTLVSTFIYTMNTCRGVRLVLGHEIQ